MEQLYLILAILALLGCIFLIWRRNREKQKIDRMTAQIEHFLLYPEGPPEESLAEGSATNLYNQISRLEQLLIVQQEAAKRQERQTTRFVENMVHQMKNALTALQIQLDLLELHASDAEQSALQKSQACMKRLTDEMDKILKSSQLAEGKIRMAFEPTDLREELAACRERLSPIAAARNVTIQVEGADSPVLSADPFWLSQAFENVMKNAVEHSPDGSTVTATLFDQGQHIRIQIADEGAGIPPEELTILFERFHRGETAKAGYGIGLSMAKDIITAHHGTISVRNREQRGAIFEIILPVLEGASPYVRQEAAEESRIQGKTIR